MENVYSASQADLSAVADESGTYQPDVWSISGRIGRLRYLAYSIANTLLIYLVFGVLSAVGLAKFSAGQGKEEMSVLAVVFLVLLVIGALSISIIYARRRLHDLDQSGWLSILSFIPLINFFFGLYLIFVPGTPSNNRFGQAPCKNSAWVIVGASLLPLFFVIGILAAIAIPEYQKYVQKTKAAQVQQVIPPEQNP